MNNEIYVLKLSKELKKIKSELEEEIIVIEILIKKAKKF